MTIYKNESQFFQISNIKMTQFINFNNTKIYYNYI